MSSNLAIVACAGAGKTSHLVQRALDDNNGSAAILSYTHNNVAELRSRIQSAVGNVPASIDVRTWHSFLLRECVRPYQSVLAPGRVESIIFPHGRSARYVRKEDTIRYFFADEKYIYADKIAEFVLECNRRLGGKVMRRLAQRYEAILIDEFQDLAGWELDLVGELLHTGIRVTVVCDPRQYIYSTNHSSKNKPYRGVGVITLFKKWEKKKLCRLEVLTKNYRSNRIICETASALWPELPVVESSRSEVEEDEGLFVVRRSDLDRYVRTLEPRILGHDKNADAGGHFFMNFGAAKGLQCERVLIIPTEPIRAYVRTGHTKPGMAVAKLYVAMTRARRSVAFLYDDSTIGISATVWCGT